MDRQSLGGTIYDRVHTAMLHDIITGVFPPGSRLKVANLCERYGLSQMPIREALQRLQGEGVVVVTPNRGARVRSIDTKFIHDVYELRAVLSIVVYRDMFSQLDRMLIDNLIEIQKRYDVALAAGNGELCDLENANFHGLIHAQCKNEEVAKVMKMGNQLVAALRAAVGYSAERRAVQSTEHWEIIHALEKHDLDLILAADEQHRNTATTASWTLSGCSTRNRPRLRTSHRGTEHHPAQTAPLVWHRQVAAELCGP